MSKKKLIVLGSVVADAVSAAIIVVRGRKKPKKLFRDVDWDKFDAEVNEEEQTEEEIDKEFEKLHEAAAADYNRFAEIVSEYPLILKTLSEVSETGKVEAVMLDVERPKFDEAVGIISRRPYAAEELVDALFGVIDKKAKAMEVIHKYVRKDRNNMSEKAISVLNQFEKLIALAKEETELCSSGDLDNYQVALHLINCSNQIAGFFKAHFMFFVPSACVKDRSSIDNEYLGNLRKVAKDLSNTDYRPFKELVSDEKETVPKSTNWVTLNGVPITLTREKAIELHREVWNWIAKEEAAYKNGEETFKDFKVPEGLTVDEVFEERCLLKEAWLENKGYSGLLNDCFLCTWAYNNHNNHNGLGFYCESCPLNWSKTPESSIIRCCFGHPSHNSYEWDDQDVDASIIANLPEIKEDEDNADSNWKEYYEE